MTGYYTDPKGNMLSFPFNSSTALFYINKDAFKKAGLDAEQPPKTWKEVVAAGEKLKAAGQECVYTTGWPSWVHIENFSAWHNVPIGTKQNGFGGLDTRVHHQFAAACEAHRDAGRHGEEGPVHLRRAHQPGRRQVLQRRMRDVHRQRRRARPASVKAGKFDWSNRLPALTTTTSKGAPQNSIIGGASLWVMSGKKPEEYKGVAKFLAFLSPPEIQMEWHTGTGYVPITKAAYEMTRKSGFYDKNPGADVSVKQLTNKTPTANSKGLRFGNFVQGRTVIEEELEAVFSGKKDAKAALDDAVKRGNEILRQFEAANKYARPGDREGGSRAPFTGLRGLRWAAAASTSAPIRIDGKARRLPLGVAALRAGGAADRDHDRVLLLAGGAGGLVLVPAAGRLRR